MYVSFAANQNFGVCDEVGWYQLHRNLKTRFHGVDESSNLVSSDRLIVAIDHAWEFFFRVPASIAVVEQVVRFAQWITGVDVDCGDEPRAMLCFTRRTEYP
jgi:hypothetical protein